MPVSPNICAELSSIVGAVLKEARERQGLSLGEVADRASLNRQAVSFIEAGERSPTAETFTRHAIALGLRPSEVWSQAEARLPSKWWLQMVKSASTRK